MKILLGSLGVHELGGGVIDPHTADSIKVAKDLRDTQIKTICLETALAVKFEDTIKEALHFTPEREKRFQDLGDRDIAGSFHVIPANSEVLKDYMRNNEMSGVKEKKGRLYANNFQ